MRMQVNFLIMKEELALGWSAPPIGERLRRRYLRRRVWRRSRNRKLGSTQHWRTITVILAGVPARQLPSAVARRKPLGERRQPAQLLGPSWAISICR